MFQLIESISEAPVRFPVMPGIKLTPGSVVKLSEYNKNIAVTLSDGYNSFGIISKRIIGGNDLNFRELAKIYPQRMIANIGNFDRNNIIEIGIPLYCNEHGVLTSKRPFDKSIILAKVITPPNNKNELMQILWL